MIPPHYSDRYVIQRYNKALEIVQHLPANSTFQPTRDEKLELYGYYKQATYGNVDAARPGLFDVVGRAKWDSWKKLEGMDRIDARHHYTETLLRAAREAYKKNSGRPIAEQIIHEFGLMQQQLTGHDSKEHKKNTITYDSPTVQEGTGGFSSSDTDAEEPAYLMQLRASTPPKRRRRPFSRRQQRPRYESSNTSTPTPDRPRTSPYVGSTAAADISLDSNPWAAGAATVPSTSTQTTPRQHPARDDDNENENPRTQTPKPRAALGGRLSTIKTVQGSSSRNGSLSELSFIALGPVTKRALESLQAEVIALNDRIDDLRKELVVRDQQRAAEAAGSCNENRSASTDDDDDDNDFSNVWKWAIKSSERYPAVNLLIIIVLFLILYRRGRTIAFALSDQVPKLWRSVKQHILFQVIV